MLQKFFYSLYTTLIALFDKGKPQLVPLALYKQSIFNPVGLWTLVAALGLVLTFYYVFNGRALSALLTLGWFRGRHWLLVLLLAAGLGAWLAYYISLQLGAAAEPYLRYFIIVNALVAATWYFLLSLLANLLVRHGQARATPFRV